MKNQTPVSKPETAAPTEDVVGVDVPPLVRPYVEADYINALAEKQGQLREMQADMLVLQTIEMERTDELARAIGISVGRESWWGSTAAEKHNVLVTRIKRLRANSVYS
jgi:hypothetical protein